MKTALQKLLMLVLSICLAAGVLELGVRALLPPPQMVEISVGELTPTEATEINVGSRIDENTTLYQRTAQGLRLRPNTRVQIQNHYLCNCAVHFSTNALGFRGPPIGEKHRTRVLFLGDSITLADYIPEDETWIRIAESELSSTATPIEAVNAGVWAVGLANELAILKERGLRIKPDVVVLGFYLNDVAPSPGVEVWEPPSFLRWSWAAWHLFKRVGTLDSYRTQRRDLDFTEETAKMWSKEIEAKFPSAEGDHRLEAPAFSANVQTFAFDWGSSWSDSVWDQMMPYFVELKRLSELHGFELAIVVFPVSYQVDSLAFEGLYNYPQLRIESIGEELDIPVLDVLPALRAAWKTSQEPLFYDWCHHTPRGNRIIGMEVAKFLKNAVLRDGVR